MTQDDKVLFLFAQTCTVLSKPTSTPDTKIDQARSRLIGPDGQVCGEFDKVYSMLEQKLNEKLKA